MPSRDRLAPTLALSLTFATAAAAHRTEDYLQAARVGLEPGRVVITLDLTPGTAVGEAFLASVDRDADGALSAEEERRHAAQVVRGLALALDERPVQLRLTGWTFSEPAAFRRGEGLLRLRIEAAFPVPTTGSHRLRFRNTYLSGHSAYLANALVPESNRVAVTAQRRTRDQGELTIEYTLGAD